MSNARENKTTCVCGHWREYHVQSRVAGRRPCTLVGCACDLFSEVPAPGATEGAAEVLAALDAVTEKSSGGDEK